MASRIIHLCISKKVCSKIELDESRFILGNLAPDASLNKDKSHFVLGDRRDDKSGRYIDYDAFSHTYYKVLQDSFFFGYLCHLISDELWHVDIYKNYLKTSDDKERNILLKKYYNDFKLLNSKLIIYYGLIKDTYVFGENILKEFNSFQLEKVTKELNQDFNISDSMVNESLDLFKFEDIINYIEKASEETIKRINKIREGL